jgi:hypothetical protein
MSSCAKIIGSKTSLMIGGLAKCGQATPVIQRVKVLTPAVVNSTTIGVQLDAAFTPTTGAYTAASVIPIYANTYLYFGAGLVPVKVTRDALLTLTGTTLEIAPANAAVAALTTTATAQSYLAGRLCLETKNITTSPQTGQANEDCGDNLLVQVYTGFTKDMSITGFPSTSAAFWLYFNSIGEKLENVYFYLDYDSKYGRYGQGQLTPASDTNNTAAQLLGFSANLSITDIDTDLPAGLVGYPDPISGAVYTAGAIAAANTRRALYGLAPLATA